MTQRQEQRAYRKVNAAAIALLRAESELMETPINPPFLAPRELGCILDAAHETVHRLINTGPLDGPCEGCNDKGWLIFTDNQIQRCDNCQRFEGDLDAARAFFRDPEASQAWSLQAIVVTQRTTDTVQTSARPA